MSLNPLQNLTTYSQARLRLRLTYHRLILTVILVFRELISQYQLDFDILIPVVSILLNFLFVRIQCSLSRWCSTNKLHLIRCVVFVSKSLTINHNFPP